LGFPAGLFPNGFQLVSFLTILSFSISSYLLLEILIQVSPDLRGFNYTNFAVMQFMEFLFSSHKYMNLGKYLGKQLSQAQLVVISCFCCLIQYLNILSLCLYAHEDGLMCCVLTWWHSWSSCGIVCPEQWIAVELLQLMCPKFCYWWLICNSPAGSYLT
jgi:hypothetical protein